MQQLEAHDITKVYDHDSGPVTALQDVSFAVDEQEFVAFLGPSGCGKTTLLRILAGLVQPTSGRVEYREGETFDRGDIGFVFQDYALYPWRTVSGNLRAARILAEQEPDPDTVRAHLEMVGLAGSADQYPHQLSGGMQQRVAVARALVTDPAVVLMDEPFAALDALTKERLYDEFTGILDRTSLTTVYVTHDIREAFLFADRIILLSGDGTVAERIDHDAPRDTAALESDAFFTMKDRILSRIQGDVA